MLATIGWVKDGDREAYARVARAMGEAEDADAAVSAYERLVRSSGLKISLIGDRLELNRPEKLAEHMASPANTPMRKSTARDISDADLLMLAQRVYALA
jgi:alcohol dehydrogenase class IV